MARAPEFAALDWLATNGMRVPSHLRIAGLDAGQVAGVKFGPPWVVKPDVAVGGKGNLGAVRVARTIDELSEAISAALDFDAGAGPAGAACVEEFVPGQEYYLSISIDDSRRSAVVRCSNSGGVGFDARTAPIWEPGSDELLNPGAFDRLLQTAGISDQRLASEIRQIGTIAWDLFRRSEAILIEFNPIRWDGHRAVPVGFALEFDDNATPTARAAWPEIERGVDYGRPQTDREAAVARADKAQPRLPMVRFLELQGDTALLIVGGGAALLCFDHLRERGAEPACYADYSPGAGADKLKALVEAGLTVPGVEGAIFGAVVVSLADVMELARGLVDGIGAAGVDARQLPIVARIAGPNEEQARALLNTVPGLIALGREHTLEQACDRLLKEMGKVD